MTDIVTTADRHAAAPALAADKPLAIAVLAMGGQGGGVLADWIVAVAEENGWVAQSTSVPGVAQRTGATIYYIEAIPAREGREPVLSLMPTPGDVDVVIAAELMEAGRSVLRGLVTPDRTTLIASTHRSFAVIEKEKPGDGIGNPTVVTDATDFAARRTIAFDMETLAVKNGSVVSAALFGAVAAAGVLPFSKEAFEATIRAGGKGVEPSLRAFNAAYERTRQKPKDTLTATPPKRLDALPETAGHAQLDALVQRIRQEFPAEAWPLLYAGVRKLTDFQDPAYADEYLDRVATLHALDREHDGAARGHAFTVQAAKYTAVAMAYDDVIRVADLKVRASRFERVRREVGAKADQIVYTTEYMHPRMEEICGTLPKGWGEWIENRPTLFARLDRLVNRGRRVRTGTLFWFAGLYGVSALRRIRRKTLRHAREAAHREAWLALAADTIAANYDLAVEVLNCRRLIKGYSDTHARGHSKFDRVLSALPALTAREDGAAWLRRLRQAALLDEEGVALDGALKTVATL
ncbi:indolepyruvate ferredoxin oxidoreductase beta subunit [Pseudochelatococcus lubricantis]|uniref:Indolepyruvate ferredoxin oxidoreductase beta subunit n=1 Tax=Pseudochelatococcus lubricantis TaxID=1538102 RepID=A0ABX0V116_9HYPH|nr:indolepyruvate oxidoreductase subunit beta family protein [Pseudochelatococcus lubricantis]NIJ58892.1 indolepyruvate ferredoxin oxidoreductase beta subunit [Pseudochelatococcus lubricantis]